MSTEREVIRLGKSTPSVSISVEQAKELHKQETGESLEERKARIARVLDRGITADRLSVSLPNDMYGEWVSRDPVEIDRKRLLGFKIDDTYAVNRSLHSDGSSAPTIADVIFMVTTMENKHLIDAVKRERFEKLHGSFKKKRGPQAEEQSFAAQVTRETGGVVPIIDEGAVHPAGKEEIAAALRGDDEASRRANQD